VSIQIKDLKNSFVILRNGEDLWVLAIWLADDLLVHTSMNSFCMAQFATQHLPVSDMILKS